MRINMTTINRKTGLNDKPYNLIITSMERIYPALQWGCMALTRFDNYFFLLHFTLPQMSVFVLQYMSGFGNEFSSEDPRCPGSLPEGQVTWDIFICSFIGHFVLE